MRAGLILDTVERLFRAGSHPDITEVSRYDDGTVCVIYQSNAKVFVWPVTDNVSTRLVEQPADLGKYEFRAAYALKLLTDLLAVAKPEGWRWRTVAVDGVHLAPCGIEVWSGGTTVLLRVTSASTPQEEDSDPADWADYQLPASIA